jgi:lysozyme family protein
VNYTFSNLKPEYEQWLQEFKPNDLDKKKAMVQAGGLLKNKMRFFKLQQASTVPALWVMPVFYRENPSFNTYLGNGDPLSHATTHVPKHRGPFGSWEEGAEDALRLDDVTGHHEWNWPFACFMWESWNGFGPRRHGRPTGYVTAGSNIYQGGKYVEDGVWSRGTWDHQLGTLILARALVELSPDLEFSVPALAPPILQPAVKTA